MIVTVQTTMRTAAGAIIWLPIATDQPDFAGVLAEISRSGFIAGERIVTEKLDDGRYREIRREPYAIFAAAIATIAPLHVELY